MTASHELVLKPQLNLLHGNPKKTYRAWVTFYTRPMRDESETKIF